MSEDAYTIEIRRAPREDFDELVYREGPGRELALGCLIGDAPMPVWVPDGASWIARTPAWAHEHRAILVERLRARDDLLVYEWRMDGWHTVTTIRAPDGGFYVETRMEPDDRAPAWERTRILLTAGDVVLANLPLHATEKRIEFPRAGVVTLSLRGHYGDRHALTVDVARRRYVLDTEPEAPLSSLESRLYPARPEPMRAKTVAASPKPAAGPAPRWLAYAPLIGFALELPWLLFLLFAFLFAVGDSRYTHTPGSPGARLMALVSIVPALAGIMLGAIGARRGALRQPSDRIALAIGVALCTLFTLWFGRDAIL